MRGSLVGIREVAHALGIIPAHAGLTVHVSINFLFARDHPRACGAHSMSDNWL